MSSDTSGMKSKDISISLENILPALAKNLYGDDWRISIRELLQNCHDALVGRKSLPRGEAYRVEIIPDPSAGTLTFGDNGIGMTLPHVEQYLATVGYSGKREQIERLKKENPEARGELTQLIGQYGIGFLSAFIIADRVEVLTKSATEPSARGVRAVFTGGTKWYFDDADVRDIKSPGTRVKLFLKKDDIIDPVTGKTKSLRDLLTFQRLQEEVRRFGDLLPFPIYVYRTPDDRNPALTNTMRGPWEDNSGHSPQVIEFLTKRHEGENDPFWAEPFRLHHAQDGVDAHGIIYFPTPPQELQKSFESVSRVDLFSRRMFISSEMKALLPEWAIFVGVLVECPDLTPTLNRNDVIRHDAAFAELKKGLSRQVVDVLKFLAEKRRQDFHRVISAHQTRLYKALLEDIKHSPQQEGTEFFRTIIKYIPFTVFDRSRPAGQFMTLPEYIAESAALKSKAEKPQIYYFGDQGAMSQWRALIVQKDIPVILATKEGEALLLECYGQVFGDECSVVDVRKIKHIFLGETEEFDETPYERMKQFLKSLDGAGPDEVTVSKFDPPYVPALMTLTASRSPEQANMVETWIKQGGAELDPKLRKAMDEAAKAAKEGREFMALTLNANNKVVQKIRDNCVRGLPLSGMMADVLHEIYHNARAITDPSSAMTEHFFDHRNTLLCRLLEREEDLEDLRQKNDRLAVQVENIEQKNIRLTDELKTRVLPPEKTAGLEHRNAALLLTDLRGSTRMVGFLDNDESSQIFQEYAARIKAVIEKHGGTVDKFTGDGLFASFWSREATSEELVKKACDCAFEVLGVTDQTLCQGKIATLLRDRASIVIEGCRTFVHFGSVVHGIFAGAPALMGKHVVALCRAVDKKELFERCPVLISESALHHLRPARSPEPLERGVELDPSLAPMAIYPHPTLAGKMITNVSASS